MTKTVTLGRFLRNAGTGFATLCFAGLLATGAGCLPAASNDTGNGGGGSSGSSSSGGSSSDSSSSSSSSSGGSSSSSSSSSSGGGGSSSSSSSSSKGGGGSSSSSSSGGGGSSSSSSSSSSASGGGGSSSSSSPPAGGSSGTSGPVTCTTDLMTLRSGDRNDWVATSPQTCGIQGSLYAYSDGSTCTSPSPISATACAAGTTGCCIKGTTVIDSTYAKYGCGLGLDLNSSGGASATKSAYSGPAKGFKITLTGTVEGGQKVRIMYSSAATDPSGGTAPYKEVDGPGTYSVLFSDATCPSWATGGKCTAVTGSAAYSIKVQLSGGGATGDPVGPFDICITSLTPIN